MSPGRENWAMKKIQRRRMVRKAAMTGISLLNLILSSSAPATPLDKQFIIPLTPGEQLIHMCLTRVFTMRSKPDYFEVTNIDLVVALL